MNDTHVLTSVIRHVYRYPQGPSYASVQVHRLHRRPPLRGTGRGRAHAEAQAQQPHCARPAAVPRHRHLRARRVPAARLAVEEGGGRHRLVQALQHAHGGLPE